MAATAMSSASCSFEQADLQAIALLADVGDEALDRPVAPLLRFERALLPPQQRRGPGEDGDDQAEQRQRRGLPMTADPPHGPLPRRIGPRQHRVAAQEAAEIVGQIGDRGVAIRGRLGRGLRDDRAELAGNRLAVGVHERLAHPRAGLRQHLGQRAAAERTLQRDQLEQDQPERALVALRIELVVASVRLFRRHVERRPDDRAVRRFAVAGLEADRGAADGAGPGGTRGAGARGGRRGGGLGGLGHQPADAPVHDVDLVVPAHHQVRRLEVAMDHAALVRVGDGVADLQEVLEARRQGMVLVRRFVLRVERARVGDQLAERLAFDQLHGVGRPSARRDLEAVDRDDVRMIELRGHLHLAHEARAGRPVVRDLERQLLERHAAKQLDVAGDVDRAHAALTGHRLAHVADAGRGNRRRGPAVGTGGGTAARRNRRVARRREPGGPGRWGRTG